MADFTAEQKVFVVRMYGARYDTSEIATAFVDHFELTPADKPKTAQLARYNADFKAGHTLSPELRQAFDKAREEADADLSAAAVSSLAFRVRELTDLYRRAKRAKNDGLAKALLEQSAREMGGMYKLRVEGVTPDQVHDYVARQMAIVSQAVTQALGSDEEGARVNEAIRTALEEGKSSRPTG